MTFFIFPFRYQVWFCVTLHFRTKYRHGQLSHSKYHSRKIFFCQNVLLNETSSIISSIISLYIEIVRYLIRRYKSALVQHQMMIFNCNSIKTFSFNYNSCYVFAIISPTLLSSPCQSYNDTYLMRRNDEEKERKFLHTLWSYCC